jgi:calcineurin-like phosphoesterase family protein
VLKPIKLSNVSDDNVWFISDLHLRHNPRWRPTLFEQRGFSSIEDHDKYVIEKINELVKPTDHLFLLGDFCLNTTDSIAEQLLFDIKANKHIVWGNHESQVSKVYKRYLTYL